MSKNIEYNAIKYLIADIFMCEKRRTANDLSYWNLRLITNGKLIEAFHWEDPRHPLQYRHRDGVHVTGRWTNLRKDRIQILRSQLITTCAANYDSYCQDQHIQLEMDFDDVLKINRG